MAKGSVAKRNGGAADPVRISKRTVNEIKPTGAEFTIWDCDLIGFGIRVRASGAMSYVVQYRPGGGRAAPTRRLTLAAVGKLEPDKARRLAKDKLAEVAKGGDPAADKADRRAGVTVNELVDAFLERHVATKRKAGTATFYRGVLDTHVRPTLGSKRAADVTRKDIGELHHHLKEKRAVKGADGRDRVVGGPVVANRVLAVLAAMYSWAGKAALIDEGLNPVAKIEKYREEGRERFLSTEEIERLGEALREAETIGLPFDVDPSKPGAKHAPRAENRRTVYSPHVTGAIRLLLLTGCRLREILNLEWSQVDVGRGLLNLPDSKTGKKTVVLGAPAAAVLAGLPRVGKFVIAGETAGQKDETPRHDIKKPWSRITARAGLVGLRLHDLRHSFASIGVGSNLNLPVIGKLLGHTQARTTQKYAHLAIDPVKRAADMIGWEIANALGEPVPSPAVTGGADVVPLRRKR
ncbi:tyrosine-type recombinase/integrase [Rhodoplanes serenus]|uniref:Tyrosine-type recombinase/integrase n=1 Tax=Rhodoplanes serenus TaxID=200615 RepID=A0A9X4XK63_9BRAD|nr:site-specific integrase [Rhodoplanes serenus]MTW16615.1 tyrosine-type recombinase/integrase [Rhodoplanes serenus]